MPSLQRVFESASCQPRDDRYGHRQQASTQSKRRRTQNTAEELPAQSGRTHDAADRSLQAGPGSELRKMLAWFARPSDTCKCETRAETMNDWGVEGCRTNLDTIIEWLLEEAQLRGLPHGKFTRTIAKSLVLTAIRGSNVSSRTVHPSPTKTIQIPDEEDR